MKIFTKLYRRTSYWLTEAPSFKFWLQRRWIPTRVTKKHRAKALFIPGTGDVTKADHAWRVKMPWVCITAPEVSGECVWVTAYNDSGWTGRTLLPWKAEEIWLRVGKDGIYVVVETIEKIVAPQTNKINDEIPRQSYYYVYERIQKSGRWGYKKMIAV